MKPKHIILIALLLALAVVPVWGGHNSGLSLDLGLSISGGGSPTGAAGALLREDGSFRLREDGTFMLREN